MTDSAMAYLERQLIDDALAEVLEAAGIPRQQPTSELAHRATHKVVGPTRPTGSFSPDQVRRMFGLPSTDPWLDPFVWSRASTSEKGQVTP